ncbi:MAG: redoxin domain-containing protein [bacterium]
MSEHDGRASTASETKILGPGHPAPDFELESAPGKRLRLGDFRGSPLVLAFYPADWSPVCGDQLALYNEVLPEFREHDAHVVGISVDGPWCHAAYSRDRNLHFALLSDFEPKGAVSRTYGAYRDHDGTSERALFVIDDDGVIRWSQLSPIDVNPGADGILEALETMTLRRDDARAAEQPRAASAAQPRPRPEPEARS